MEEEGNVEHDCVGEDSAYEIREDDSCPRVMRHEGKWHDRKGDAGFGVDKEGEGNSKDN